MDIIYKDMSLEDRLLDNVVKEYNEKFEFIKQLVNASKLCIETKMETMLKIELREDLLKHVRRDDLVKVLGGNTNPAFCNIINMYNNNNKIQILISMQRQDLPPKKNVTLWGRIKKYLYINIK